MSIKKLFNRIYILFLRGERYCEYLRKKGMRIGKNTEIDKSVIIGTEPWLISVGDNSRISKNAKLITHDGGILVLRGLGLVKPEAVKYGTIKIGNNVNIGWDAIIMPNVKIGNNCILAAGAVLTHDMPDNTIYGGVPAKEIETIQNYYEKNKDVLIMANGLNSIEKRKLTEYLMEE